MGTEKTDPLAVPGKAPDALRYAVGDRVLLRLTHDWSIAYIDPALLASLRELLGTSSTTDGQTTWTCKGGG